MVKFNHIIALILSFVLLDACMVNGPVSTRKFSFYKDNKPGHISIRVPGGFSDEKVRLGAYGKEQYYTYNDGSVFFVGR